jgi:hypothetical protein
MATFFILLTSGIQGPEAELTDEQVQKIEELALQLNQPWVGSTHFGMGLGPTNYGVHSLNKISGLRVLPQGYATIWKPGDTEWHDFIDTVGLWAYLATIGSPVLQKWLEDGQKAMDKYNEEMFGTTE